MLWRRFMRVLFKLDEGVMFKLSNKSLDKLKGLHPDLQSVVHRAIQITSVDFTVLEGLRTMARQKELYAQGATKTLNSRHLDGHAVDLGAYMGGEIRWDWPLYHKIADAMKQAAKELDVPLTWGGDWKSFPDGPHFELPWDEYPS